MNNWQERISIKWFVMGFGAFIVIIVLVSILVNLLKPNPYGPEIIINNFDMFFDEVPGDRKDLVQASLYNVVSRNITDNILSIPESGAMIRDGSVESHYSENEGVWVGSFIVDIEEIRQSYDGFFEWGGNGESFGGGYVALFTCLRTDQLIYGDFDCKDMFSDDISTKFPITTKLPLTVSEYSNNYTKYVNYYIGYTISDDHDEIVIDIKDYIGNGREDALQKIRDLGYDPDDYEIDYKNVSSEYEMNYVGN